MLDTHSRLSLLCILWTTWRQGALLGRSGATRARSSSLSSGGLPQLAVWVLAWSWRRWSHPPTGTASRSARGSALSRAFLAPQAPATSVLLPSPILSPPGFGTRASLEGPSQLPLPGKLSLAGFRDSTQMLNFPVPHLLPARASPASSQETLCSAKSDFIPLQPGRLEPAYRRQKLCLSFAPPVPPPESDTQRVKCTCAPALIHSVNPGALERRQRQNLRAGEVYILTGETDDKHTDITRLVLGSWRK